MGRGRRWLAGVLLLAVSAAAAEPPDAPSTERFQPIDAAAAIHDLSGRPAFELAEWVAPPMAIEAPAPARKVFDKKFALLAGLAVGLTVADFEMTQRCLQRHTCAEANPLMPTSHAGMYATNIPLNAALFWWSYRRRQDGKRLWWLAPLMVVASHAVGVGTNLRFLGK
jgi:hypothetical protein